MHKSALVAFAWLAATAVAAETHVEIINESRLNLLFAVPETEAQALLPAGWAVSPVPGGPAAGANVLLTLLDRLAANGPDGKPLDPASNRLAVLVVMGRNTATGEAAAVVVGGWSDEAAGAPGAYGNFVDAEVRLTRQVASGLTQSIEERWSIVSPDGDGLSVAVASPRGQAALARFDQRVHSGTKTGFFRIYRGDQGAFVVHSAPMGVARATTLDVAATGPLLGSLIDGEAQLVAVIHLPWYRRDTFLP